MYVAYLLKSVSTHPYARPSSCQWCRSLVPMWLVDTTGHKGRSSTFHLMSTNNSYPDISIPNPCLTQENYITQDNSGMCHLMPQWHLLEWQYEEEQAFVHGDSSKPNKDLDNTVLANVNCNTWSHYYMMDDTLASFMVPSITVFIPLATQGANQSHFRWALIKTLISRFFSLKLVIFEKKINGK